MTSTFTWLDYSEHERRRMLDVIDLFGEQSTRDELGLGSVRDAFADLLFPGTSTIQTRAKYFLFVPWIYRELEAKRTGSSKIALRARRIEIELAAELEQSTDSAGTIGRLAKEQLQRLPSTIYWQGLYQWGIRLFPGSIDEYHRSLDRSYASLRASRASRHEHEGESSDEAELQHWHAGLPDPENEFPSGATMTLRKTEAEYLRERILTSCAPSLLAHLVKSHVDVVSTPFVWGLLDELPERLRVPVRHGQLFSETIHGAQLLYNLMIAEQRLWEEKIVQYHESLVAWWERVSAQVENLQTWDRADFWRTVRGVNPRVSPQARRFIDLWIGVVTSASVLSEILNDRSARKLVEDREVKLKKGLSRLRNGRARELWSGAAGAAKLDLRWTSARQIVSDILHGMEADDDA